MRRCTICVLPETFPGITFDSEGVCAICAKFREQREFIPSIESLGRRFRETVEKHRGKSVKYDAVVAFSGGKDSTYLLYVLGKTYGLQLLAYTFDNGFMSDFSFENMKRIVNALNVDHIVFRPGKGVMKRLFSACSSTDPYPEHLVKFGSSICISCIRMVTNGALRLAIEKKIPMVMLGNSPGQLIQSENEIMYKDNLIPYSLRAALFKPLAALTGQDIYHYLMLTEEEYASRPFPIVINAFPIIGYDENEVYRTITDLGWKRPGDVDPNSTNCRLNSLGIVKHLERLKFHPYDYEMSMLVRMGIITRDQALSRIEDPERKALELAKQLENELSI